MLKRKLIRKKRLHDFMLKATHMYYRDKYAEFLKEVRYEESLCPSIYKIDEIMLNLKSQKSCVGKKGNLNNTKIKCDWNFFINIDLEDLY